MRDVGGAEVGDEVSVGVERFFESEFLAGVFLDRFAADFERWLIEDTFACRRGKGREAALRRAEHHAARHGWFLKLDVAKYFDSIPHAVLLGEIARRWRDRRVVALWERIVRCYETAPGRGLPIGALTSQHLANFFLGAADRYVKETLRVPGYARYMDEMALWGGRAELKAAVGGLRIFLAERLGLTLKGNWHLQPVVRGMDFLGYRVFPGGSRLARPSRRRFLRRWVWCERARACGDIGEREAQRRVLALTAFVRVARCERVLQKLFGPPQGGPQTDHGHRAPTASTAVAVGGMTPRIVAPRIATGIRPATATTTSASASPSVQFLSDVSNQKKGAERRAEGGQTARAEPAASPEHGTARSGAEVWASAPISFRSVLDHFRS